MSSSNKNPTNYSDQELEATSKEIVSNYEHTESRFKYIIKNNFLVGIEELRIDQGDNIVPLNFTETQLLMTAFRMAHELNEQKRKFDANTVFQINIKNFCQMWNLTQDKHAEKNGLIYHNIINSISRLNKRIFRYHSVERNVMVESGYFQYIEYGQGVIKFGFPKPIIYYLSQMNRYTWYYFENVVKLMDGGNASSLTSYSVTLYEQLQKGKNLNLNPNTNLYEFFFAEKKIKKLLAVPSSYLDTKAFNRLLTRIINHINAKIGIQLNVEYIKEGRKVVEYKFTCILPECDTDFEAAIKLNGREQLLTHKQRWAFANKLSQTDLYFTNSRLNESREAFTERLATNDLFVTDKIIEYWPFLEAMGIKSEKVKKVIAQMGADKKSESDAPNAIEEGASEADASNVIEGEYSEVDASNIIQGKCDDQDDNQIPF